MTYYCCGEWSLEGGKIFEEEHGVKVIGIRTIDNDFKEQYLLGYDNALNTAVEAIDKIRDTAISHNRLFLLKQAGLGYIVINAGIGAGAERY